MMEAKNSKAILLRKRKFFIISIIMKIHYVTGNKGKFEEAAKVLDLEFLASKGFEIVHTPLDLEEIQGSSRKIAEHKILEAFSKLHEPCIIDDISLHCPAIGGLPGPYVRSFLEAIGDEGIAKLISNYSDRSCRVVCHIAFGRSLKEIDIFEGSLEGTIVMPRGERMAHTYSWNGIVQETTTKKTLAELSLDEASKISARSKALNKFRLYLLHL